MNNNLASDLLNPNLNQGYNPNQPNMPYNPNQQPNQPFNPNQPNMPYNPNQQPNQPFNPNQPNMPYNPNQQPNQPFNPNIQNQQQANLFTGPQVYCTNLIGQNLAVTRDNCKSHQTWLNELYTL